MSLRRSRKRRKQESEDLDVTALLNLLIILLPILLASAAFTHMADLNVNLPAASQQTNAESTPIQLEVVVTDNGMVVDNGQRVIANIARSADGRYNFAQLSRVMRQIKQAHPDSNKVTILLQDNTKYHVMVHTMDAVRMFEIADPEHPGKTVDKPLFPTISLGDAPGAG